MNELILKSFNGLAQRKSYGGNSLEVNLENAQKAIEKVQYTARIWDRSRSQYMIKFLTCSNADGWLRMRQLGAEMDRKRQALSEAKYGYMKHLTKAKIKSEEMEGETSENKRLLLEIEAAEFEATAGETMVKFEGALKEVETLANMHDSLKTKLGDITEEEFEKAQAKAHIKRAVNQAVREVKQDGKIHCGNAEYLEQSGLCTTAILKDIFIFLEEESEAGTFSTGMLHKFLDDTADKYGDCYIQQAEWLGFNPHADKNLTYEP